MNSLARSLAKIKQSAQKKYFFCIVEKTKLIVKILFLFQTLGFIQGFTQGTASIIVHLRYKSNKTVIRRLGLLSRESKRVYLKASQVKLGKLFGYNKGPAHVFLHASLPGAVFTDVECALLNIGGEPILVIG